MADTMDLTLENVLIFWENEEQKVEKKLELLEKYIFNQLKFDHEPGYYEKHGKFLDRFAAGFIHGYFNTASDISFILLDPIHIIDILTTLVKNMFLHPLQTLKSIWETWTYYFTHGTYGLGMMLSEITIGCLLVAIGGILSGQKLTALLKNAASSFSEGVVGNLKYIPEKIVGIPKMAKSSLGLTRSVLKNALSSPGALISDALKSLEMGDAYGKIREYRLYADKFMSAKA